MSKVVREFKITPEMSEGFPVVINGTTLVTKETVQKLVQEYTLVKVGLSSEIKHALTVFKELYDYNISSTPDKREMIYRDTEDPMYRLFETFRKENKGRYTAITKATDAIKVYLSDINALSGYIRSFKKNKKCCKKLMDSVDYMIRKDLLTDMEDYLDDCVSSMKELEEQVGSLEKQIMESVLWFIYAYQLITIKPDAKTEHAKSSCTEYDASIIALWTSMIDDLVRKQASMEKGSITQETVKTDTPIQPVEDEQEPETDDWDCTGDEEDPDEEE